MMRAGTLSVLAVLVFMTALVASPALAGTASFGISGPTTKIGTGTDTWSAGRHSLAYSSNSDSVYAVWLDGSSGTSRVMFAEGAEGGTMWGASVPLATASGWTAPTIATSGSAIHVTWGSREGTVTNVYYRRSSNYGSTWSAPVAINGAINGDTYGMSVAADSQGNVFVAWHSSARDVYVSRSSDGLNWTTVQINQTGVRGQEPSIAVDGSDNIFVAWCGTPGLTFSKSTSGGVTWSAPVDVDGGLGSDGPSLAAYDMDNIYVTWKAHGVLYCAYTSTGGDTAAEWSQSIVGDSGSTYPSIAVSPIGDVNIAWEANYQQVYLSRSSDGGARWKDTFLVYDGGTWSNLAIDPNNKALIMFIDRWDDKIHFTKEQ